MTLGYGPDTFPHSAAHILNTNHSPSTFEGEPINKNNTSAANHNEPSAYEGDSKHFKLYNSMVKTTCLTSSDLWELSNPNKDDTKISLLIGSTLSELPLPNFNGIKNAHFSQISPNNITER